ncbi:NAD(+)/NADH kinase [Candidatus Woesearchaeota archaeon]|nr:NAD(+)/NADH kinase [Candidatus Woesearchaeota archaeon]
MKMGTLRRVAVVAKDQERIAEVRRCLKRNGLVYSPQDPDLVLSYGGDGTFLLAHRLYPTVPKIMVRDSKVCKKCLEGELHHLLRHVERRDYTIERLPRLEARYGRHIFHALNDVIIRNSHLTRAIRYTLSIDGRPVGGEPADAGEEFIGDGLVIATPFGSSAYFYSITKRTFRRGIGIAFNNITTTRKPLILPRTATVVVRIARGPALLGHDNHEETLTLAAGDEIAVKVAGGMAERVILPRH